MGCARRRFCPVHRRERRGARAAARERGRARPRRARRASFAATRPSSAPFIRCRLFPRLRRSTLRPRPLFRGTRVGARGRMVHRRRADRCRGSDQVSVRCAGRVYRTRAAALRRYRVRLPALSVIGLAAAEQPLDIGQRQGDVGRAAVIALAADWGSASIWRNSASISGWREAAAGAYAGVAGERTADAASMRSFSGERVVPFGQFLGEVADQSGDLSSPANERRHLSRTMTAPDPKPSRMRPKLPPTSSGAGHDPGGESGIELDDLRAAAVPRATPRAASASFMRSWTMRSCAAC